MSRRLVRAAASATYSLADLHPLFQPVAALILRETSAIIAPSTIRASVTFRTIEQQGDAKATGVTNLSIGYHNFGLAMDAAVITPGGVYVTNGEDWRYRVFGMVAKLHGCVWGGDWIKKDWDHVEYCNGLTVAQFMVWANAHSLR